MRSAHCNLTALLRLVCTVSHIRSRPTSSAYISRRHIEHASLGRTFVLPAARVADGSGGHARSDGGRVRPARLWRYLERKWLGEWLGAAGEAGIPGFLSFSTDTASSFAVIPLGRLAVHSKRLIVAGVLWTNGAVNTRIAIF